MDVILGGARICAYTFFDHLCEKIDKRIIVPNNQAVMASYEIIANRIEQLLQRREVADMSTIAAFEHDVCVASCACTSAVYCQILPYKYCENKIKKYIDDSCYTNISKTVSVNMSTYRSSLSHMYKCAAILSTDVNETVAVDLVDEYCKWLVSALTLLKFVNSYSR